MNEAQILSTCRRVHEAVLSELCAMAPANKPGPFCDRIETYRQRIARAHFHVSSRMTSSAGKAFVPCPGFEDTPQAWKVVISLPIFADPRNTERAQEQLEETIRHELAHLACPHTEGHGPLWKQAALAVGAKPERGHDMAVIRRERRPRKRYKIACQECGKEAGTKIARNRPTQWLANRVHMNCGGRLEVIDYETLD